MTQSWRVGAVATFQGRWRVAATCRNLPQLAGKGGATVGQWGQTAPTGMRLWGQNYLFAPTENQQILKEGIIRVFSKMLELFSGRCRWRWLTAKTKDLFFSKLPFLQMPALQSWSGCQPLLLRAGCRYSCKYPYIPIDLTLAGDFLTTGWEFCDTR